MPDRLDPTQLQIIAAYGDQTAVIAERVSNVAGTSWDNLSTYREAEIARWVRQIAPVMGGAQQINAALTDRYLAAIGSTMTDRIVQPVGVPASVVTTEALRDGVDDDELYRRPAYDYWKAIGTGQPPDDAQRRGRALLLGIVASNLQLSRTHAARHVMAAVALIVGYRRVLSSGSCTLCASSSGRFSKHELLPMHSHCRCGMVPVYKGGPDPGMLETIAPTDDRGDSRVVHHGEVGPMLVARGDQFTR